jgi:hypothetical protein
MADWLADLASWAWARHHNVLSWYVRSLVWAFVVVNAALLFKIGWSYRFDESGTGADALVVPALTGLVVVDVGLLAVARLRSRKRASDPTVAHG